MTGAQAAFRALAAREDIARRVQQLHTKYHIPIVIVSLRLPAPARIHLLGSRCHQRHVIRLIEEIGVPPLGRESATGALGPVTLLAIPGSRELLKARCVTVEAEDPLGAFCDADVWDGRVLNRADLGMPARQCLLCGRASKECVALGRHRRPVIATVAIVRLVSALAQSAMAPQRTRR